MGILTSQKIGEYYERFKAIDVTFSKELIQVTGLITNQIFLKCVADSWPCVIFSSSFQGAKVVVSLKSGILQKLERANNMVSLRFCFKSAEMGNTVTFFINTKTAGYAPYGNSQDVALFTLQFTQRPPDDLIEIMGRILDANVNSAKRREERILMNPETYRKLNIASKESAVFIQGVPRHCILRDISFSGAKLIMMGIAKFLEGKDAALRMDFEDPRQSFLLRGQFIRSEAVEGRKDLVALVILFDESNVPMGYKLRINDYLSQVRADSRTGGDSAEKKPSPIPAKPEQKPPAPAPQAAAAKEPPPGKKAPEPEKPAAPAPAAKPTAAKPSGDDDFDLSLPS